MDAAGNINDLQVDNMVLSDNSAEYSDEDDCDEIELRNTFKQTFSVCAEKAVSLDIIYILHMDVKNQNICVGLSNQTCEIFEIDESQLNKVNILKEHTSYIIGVKFNKEEGLVYTGSADGSIRLWDLRTPQKSICSFTDTSATENIKPFSCFDVSQNNRVLCAGTELFEGDSFLLFWDIRNTKLLGGYWESHMDDITQIRFHPTNKDTMASCSTDGLINVYDITQTSEDDALTCSLNTESSAEQLIWYRHNNEDAIASVTHPVGVHLWHVEDGTRHATFSRDLLSKEIKRTSPEHCYVASMHTNATKETLYVVTGSNWHHGERVRGIGITNNELSPAFILQDNKQRIRCSYYDTENEMLITGGERGILSVWKKEESNSMAPLKEITSKSKIHTKKPY